MTLVLTHGGCFDGYCAYVIARNALADQVCYYYGLQPSDLVPQLERLFGDLQQQGVALATMRLRAFDLSFSPEALRLCEQHCGDVQIYNHHQSTLDRFQGAALPKNVCVDLERSGARLAWDYYHAGESAPPLVAYIEARDLWQFERVADARAITDVLYATLQPYGFEADSENLRHWTELLHRADAADFALILASAPMLQRVKQLQIESALRKGATRRWHVQGVDGELRVFVINSDTHISDLGHAALAQLDEAGARRHDLALIWFWHERKRRFKASLRSCAASPANAAQLAARFGGGGHRNAAGFWADDTAFLRETSVFPRDAPRWPWIALLLGVAGIVLLK